MQFGVYVRPAETYGGMLELTRAAEELGYTIANRNTEVEVLCRFRFAQNSRLGSMIQR